MVLCMWLRPALAFPNKGAVAWGETSWIMPHTRCGTSPLTGEAGRGCESPDIGASLPPPLIPPHKGEGVD